MPCFFFLWLEFYASCPWWLGLLVVTCGNYDKKLIINSFIDLQIPCSGKKKFQGKIKHVKKPKQSSKIDL